jgi:hypothetical protein
VCEWAAAIVREEAASAPAAKKKKLPSALDALNKATPSFLAAAQQEAEEVILARSVCAACLPLRPSSQGVRAPFLAGGGEGH